MKWIHKNEEEIFNGGKLSQYNSLKGFAKISRYQKPQFSSISYIKMRDFRTVADVELIRKDLLDGNIMVLNAEHLLESNSVLELKRAIDQLRGSCKELGGSIGRIGDRLLIITPNPYIKINN